MRNKITLGHLHRCNWWSNQRYGCVNRRDGNGARNFTLLQLAIISCLYPLYDPVDDNTGNDLFYIFYILTSSQVLDSKSWNLKYSQIDQKTLMMQVMTGSVDGDEQKAQEEAGKVRYVFINERNS